MGIPGLAMLKLKTKPATVGTKEVKASGKFTIPDVRKADCGEGKACQEGDQGLCGGSAEEEHLSRLDIFSGGPAHVDIPRRRIFVPGGGRVMAFVHIMLSLQDKMTRTTTSCLRSVSLRGA